MTAIRTSPLPDTTTSSRPWDWVVRSGISVALAIIGYVHADLYRDGYRYIHIVGPSFLLQAAFAFSFAIVILLGAPWTLRVAAAVLALATLAGFAMSRTVGIFGFTETGWQPAPQAALSVAAEAATLLLCGLSFARSRQRR